MRSLVGLGSGEMMAGGGGVEERKVHPARLCSRNKQGALEFNFLITAASQPASHPELLLLLLHEEHPKEGGGAKVRTL